jgi:hypothetical protein
MHNFITQIAKVSPNMVIAIPKNLLTNDMLNPQIFPNSAAREEMKQSTPEYSIHLMG